MTNEQRQRIEDAADELGYTAPELRNGGHYLVTHPNTGARVFYPATPSDHRSFLNVISQLQQGSGKKLPKPNGYRGGRYIRPERSHLHEPRTSAEQTASQRVEYYLGKIRTIDARLQDIVSRHALIGSTPALRGEALTYLSSRNEYADTMARYHHTAPALDVPGLDAVISTAPDDRPADASDLNALKQHFGA